MGDDLLEGLEFPEAPCPYSFQICDKVGTFRCTESCEFHPKSYRLDEEVLKRFEAEPHAIYCLTCGQFLDTRYDHPKEHVIATGVRGYREKIPQFVMERITNRHVETGDMDW